MSAYQVPSDPTNILAKRYGAAVIDVALEGVVWVIAFVFAFALFSHDVIRYDYDRFGGNYGPYKSTELTGAGWLALLVIGLSYMIAIFVIQRGLSGKTPGTMALGLVTVNEQGKPLGPGRALLRSVAGVVDYIGICSIPIVGIATTATSKGHRRVGDMAAKSFVVDKAWFDQPVVIPGLNAPAAGPYAQPYGQPYGAPGQPYGAPGQAYGAQAYGQPYAAPGAYPPPDQPYAPPAYPPQPGYPTPPPQAPATPDTGWPGAPAEPTASATPAPAAAPSPSPDEAGWGAPGATDAPTEPSSGAAPTTPGPEAAPDPTQPQWDPARNAYIQWDPDGQRWLQFDDATQQWRPIS